MNVDYRHVQGQPEWEDVYITEPVPEWNQDWSKIDLGGYKRPEWFYDVSLQQIPDLAAWMDERDAQKTLSSDSTDASDFPQNDLYSSAKETAVRYGANILRKSGFSWLVNDVRHRISKKLIKQAGTSEDQMERTFQSLISDFSENYPDRRQALSMQDIYELLPRSAAHTPIFQRYHLVQAYSLDPIHVMLGNPGQPFVCFEHGTLRDFPFEDSARGRLYALSLKKAEAVIITNADCNRSAERLGLKNYTFIPHPVDEEIYKPEPTELRDKLVREHKCKWIFVAPARHHWKKCPPGLENSWFKRNDILIRALGNIFRKQPDLDALVVFFEWGQEVNFSRELIEECGFNNKVRWEPIRSKRAMKEFYNAADLVFDQFNDGIGTFGSVVPESFACAKPVIINYKKELHYWCYPELPPLLNAPDEGAIEKCVLDMIKNDSYRMELGNTCREWFMNHHSSNIVTDRLVDIYKAISAKYKWGWQL